MKSRVVHNLNSSKPVPEGPVFQPLRRRRINRQAPKSKLGRAIWMTIVVIATLPALLAASYVLFFAFSRMIAKFFGW
ncbi:MAG: hypothetical protein KGS45_12655 [Planctomycetes bacterium]|nr:hypothetical protein [Planctomycetota bacterium]